MSGWREAWTREVTGALEAHAVAVEQMAPGHWTFAPGLAALRVSARLLDEWLVFDAPLPPDATRRFERVAVPAVFREPPRTCQNLSTASSSAHLAVLDGCLQWRLLTANASFGGGLKLCVDHADGTVRLRAELRMGEDVPISGWVQQMCDGITLAAAWLAAPEDALTPCAPGLDEAAAADVDLEQLCGDAHWPFTTRPPRTVMVQLDVPGSFQQAAVELQPERGVVASVPVLPAMPATPVCAAAAAHFLLTATGAIRMVRAAVRPPATAVSLEVVFARSPTADQLGHACAALSVAWSAAAREAEVLAHDAHIAQLYLSEQRGSESVTTRAAHEAGSQKEEEDRWHKQQQ